jgi:hypothetical protein
MGGCAGIPKTDAKHDCLCQTTGSPVLDLLAVSLAHAFDEAESDDPLVAIPARLSIRAMLSKRSIQRLRRQNLISW